MFFEFSAVYKADVFSKYWYANIIFTFDVFLVQNLVFVLVTLYC